MKEPEFQCILKIEFENNFDLDEITKVLDVKPHYCISYEKSGYTKISKDKLSGAWWYAYPSLYDYKTSWSVNQMLKNLFSCFSEEKFYALKEIVKKQNGKIVLTINIYFYHDSLPELCFNGEVMRIINNLDADIEININEDNEE